MRSSTRIVNRRYLSAVLWTVALLHIQEAAAWAQNRDHVGSLSIVEAGQMTIDLNPQLGIQREQINYSRGSLLTQQSPFDLNLRASFTGDRAYRPLLPSTQTLYGVDSIATNTQASTMGASQLFRSGISVSPSIRLNRSSDNLSQALGVNEPVVAVQVVLPLMRNRGRAATAAGETAAVLAVEASVYDLNHAASQSLANTAAAYWNYLGSVKVLDVYQQSEQRGEEFLENVEALAQADVIPRIQIQDAIANLASRRVSRIGAEQAVIRSQQELAMAIGLTERQVTSVGPPRDSLPEPADQLLIALDPDHLQKLIDTALANRADYLGAKVRAEEQRALLGGTRNRLRPQIDLVGSMGYTGIRPGGGIDNYFRPLFLSTAGPNATVGLQYQLPAQNRAAHGALVQNEAALRQQMLQAGYIARQIASNVVTAANALNNAMLQFRQAQRGAAAALEGRRGEADRLRQGVGSVLDVLQTEDRYIAATIAEINANVAYATAIASFRLATGTYLNPGQPVQAVEREAFYSAVRQ